MTASDKLRALMEDERWKSHDSTVLSGLALEFYGTSGDGALPQIVAVVEAAENLNAEFRIDIERDLLVAPTWARPYHEFSTALTALEEALS